jgi:hypothetical protein
MECLRNLPSKTNAFQTATYERVRTEHSHSHNKPFFATSGQVPTQSTFIFNSYLSLSLTFTFRYFKTLKLGRKLTFTICSSPSILLVLPSSDENLILAVIRQKNKVMYSSIEL